MPQRKRHSGEAGYIAERMNPHMPDTKVVIYDAAKQGIDVDGKRYAVVCDAHRSIVGDTSLPGARKSMKAPDNFCDKCRAVAAEYKAATLLTIGKTVRVMNRTIGGKEVFEGMATIKSISQGDAAGIHGDVEFDEEPGVTYPRWVFAKDQTA